MSESLEKEAGADSVKVSRQNELWVCGQWYESKDEPGRSWEFQGVFDAEHKAIAACHTDDFFIFPVQLNEALPIETMPDTGRSYFPRLETKEQAFARRKQ